MKEKKGITIPVSLILTIVIMIFIIKCNNNLKRIVIAENKHIAYVINTQDTVTQDTVVESDNYSDINTIYQYIKSINIKYPEVVIAQVILETGNLTHNEIVKTNNLFGMKCAKSRPYTYKSCSNDYAVYPTWKHSVLDYALYQSKYIGSKTENEWIEFLAENYAEDSKYANKIRKVKSQLKDYGIIK